MEKDDKNELVENSLDYIIIITKLIMNISGTYEYERNNNINNSTINIPHSVYIYYLIYLFILYFHYYYYY